MVSALNSIGVQPVLAWESLRYLDIMIQLLENLQSSLLSWLQDNGLTQSRPPALISVLQQWQLVLVQQVTTALQAVSGHLTLLIIVPWAKIVLLEFLQLQRVLQGPISLIHFSQLVMHVPKVSTATEHKLQT